MSPREIEIRKQEIRVTQALLRQALIYEEAEASLRAFVNASWPVIEPGTTYVHGWHIDAICLPGNTPIETREGPKQIEKLHDYSGEVLSWNHASDKMEWRPIVRWMKSPGRPLLKIKMQDGRNLTLTDNHPVFVSDKGYVRADQIQIGDFVSIVQAVRLDSGQEKCHILQPTMLRTEQNTSSKPLQRLRRANGVGQCASVPEMLEETRSSRQLQWSHRSLSTMREGGLSEQGASGSHSAHARSILHSSMFRPIRERTEQSSLLQRKLTPHLPSSIQVCEEEGARSRWIPVFRMRSAWRMEDREKLIAVQSGSSSYRPQHEEQRSDEFNNRVSSLPSETREYDCGRAVVCSIEREVFIPEWVYNIEVSGNHNYFANGTLVHNCDHLEAVVNGEIRKLIINISPRCMKSTLCAIAFPAWVWLKNPERKFLYSSYGLHLSMRDSRKCNALIKSAWYQRCWAERFAILTAKGGQDTKQRFDNNKGGYRIATATNVGTTGDGGDVIFYDDPNDLAQMNSDAYVEQVIFFHEHVMRSRLNDPKTGARVCIQQRSSERDMTGHILSKEQGWDHLVIPMEYEGARKATSIGWVDPRKIHGELMCPDRIGPDEVKDLKANAVAWSGQYQQRPSPGEGAKFKREWFRYWNPRDVEPDPATGKFPPVRVEIPGSKEPVYKTPDRVPAAFEQVLQSWDLAFKDAEENDYVAGHVWGRVGANCYLIGHVYEHLDFVQTLARFRKMNVDFPGCPEKLIEDKANGPAVVSTLRNEIPGIIAIEPEGGKVARANAVTPYVESGNVYLPNPDIYPWVRDFIEQCANFPRAKHDDEVDAMTQALRRLYDTQANSALPEFRVSPRVGEPQSACHVTEKMHLEPHWRRWVAMVPGAALWMCETPSGALRVYRELDLAHMDGHECGRRIAEESLKDIRKRMRLVGRSARWVCDILMEKDMFEPMEPIGCLAELVADGAQNYRLEKEGFGERTQANADLGFVQFSAEMVEVIEAAWDRLRDLLRFAPPEFQKVDYDRAHAKMLFERSPDEWRSYMAAVEGEPSGEWPKVKFSSECPKTLAAIGTASRIYDVNEIAEPFLRALLVGITTPEHVQTAQPPREVPWGPNGPRFQRVHRRGGRLRIAV
jgi:predicted phage terminase large subunit-like protein